MNRLFFAFTVSESCAKSLQLVQDHLPKVGVRWTRNRHFHVTLKFLGEVDLVRQVQAQCAVRDLVSSLKFTPQDLTLHATRVDVFSHESKPAVVVAGIHMPSPFYEFQFEIEAVLEPLGFSRDRKHFKPHVTLARVRSWEHARHAVILNELGRLGIKNTSFQVENIYLFRSHLSKDLPPEYEIVETYPLIFS
jgi:2'-5' RNA ligase